MGINNSGSVESLVAQSVKELYNNNNGSMESQRKKLLRLKDLEVYQLARELSSLGWQMYAELDWQDKRIMGDQFIEAVDSVGANIAEGYFRYHFLDKIRFFYNARGSLVESSEHWLELLQQREKISQDGLSRFKMVAERLALKLNNFIASTYKAKAGNKFP